MIERKRKHLPIGWLIPNIVTIMALCSGLTSIRYALAGKWEFAALFILAAVVFDGLDGRLARLFKSSSTFGAQLDSLSDFVSFGVAPAVVLYLWGLEDVKRWGWGAVLFYSVCCALRLARFNTALFQNKDPNSDKFFTGVPAPVGAMLALLPMYLHFQYDAEFFRIPLIIGINLIIVGLLMASRIPTLSVKKMKINLDMAFPIMMVAVLFVSLIIIEPWVSVSSIVILYYLSVPVTFAMKSRMEKTSSPHQSNKDPKIIKVVNR